MRLGDWLIAFASAGALAACSAAAPPAASGPVPAPAPQTKVANASYTQPDGSKVMALSIDVPASVDQLWETWTTAEGWESFAVRHAHVDFRIGGVIETTYAETFDPASTIQNQIVAFVPKRMLTIRNIKAPVGFQNAEEFQSTVSVIEMTPLDAHTTRVSLTGIGFQPGAAYDDLFEKFTAGNSYTLEELRTHFMTKQ